MISWTRIKDGGTRSHCGAWEIRPVYNGKLVKPVGYELIKNGQLVADRRTVKSCKLHALSLQENDSQCTQAIST